MTPALPCTAVLGAQRGREKGPPSPHCALWVLGLSLSLRSGNTLQAHGVHPPKNPCRVNVRTKGNPEKHLGAVSGPSASSGHAAHVVPAGGARLGGMSPGASGAAGGKDAGQGLQEGGLCRTRDALGPFSCLFPR